jgi:predicted nucleic acid-binding protein
LIPPAVVLELERGRAIGIDLPDTNSLPWLPIQAPKRMDRVPAVTDLGAGEREVLALGTEVASAVAILDDRLARYYAEALKLTLTGTLGILLRAKVEGIVTRIEPVIDQLEHLKFRLSRRTRDAVLKLAGEGHV